MKTSSFVQLAAACVFAVATATTSAADIDSKDKTFIKDAYSDGLAEVKLGELAQAKTANPDVKAFGEHMVTDHSKANATLKTLADSKKVEVATDVGLVDQGKAKLLDAKSGADFDKAFADAMVNAHKKAVELFEKTANDAKDIDVKNFATQTLPTLKTHLSMAEDLDKKLNGK